MTERDEGERLQRKEKLVIIQSRNKAKNRRTDINGLLSAEGHSRLSFIGRDETFSLRSKFEDMHVLSELNEISDTTEKSAALLDCFSSFLSNLDEVEGVCFAYDWRNIGAFHIDTKSVFETLSALMLVLEDELDYCSHDFTGAFQLNGDRTGSGDRLNSLSVKILGSRWCEIWRESKLQQYA